MKDNETESIYKNHHCAILLKQGDYKGYHYAIDQIEAVRKGREEK